MTRRSFEGPAAGTLSEEVRDSDARASAREASAEEVRAYSQRVRALVESALDELVPAEDVDPSSIHAAIRWSLFAPGKRFRPLLVSPRARPSARRPHDSSEPPAPSS